MANFVVKKDGTKTPFKPEKIKASLIAGALDAELSNEEADKVAEKVLPLVLEALKAQEEVSTNEIREKVLSELDVVAPAVAEVWRRYEQHKGE